MPDFNAQIERGMDAAVAAVGESVTIHLATGELIVCKAVPMHEDRVLLKEAGGDRLVNRLTLEIAKAKYPRVTINADFITFPAVWARKGPTGTVKWRVAGFVGDQTSPGTWVVKVTA